MDPCPRDLGAEEEKGVRNLFGYSRPEKVPDTFSFLARLPDINSVVNGQPTPDELTKILGIGNWELFNDLYWQLLAYDSGGIEEIKKLRQSGDILKDPFNAWSQIAEGEAKNNESDIWKGNLKLLEYEQKVVL
jgi:hypothetical protein